MLIFAGIIAGIIIGIGGSALVIAIRVAMYEIAATKYHGELADLMVDIKPQPTPFMSAIERHRQKHLAARGGNFDGTGTGVRRSDPERGDADFS